MEVIACVLMFVGLVIGLAHNTAGDIVAGAAMFCFGLGAYVAVVYGPMRR